MKWDVFISYSSSDAAWAERLEKDLTARGVSVFRDQARLTAGEKWDDALRDELADSQHLLLLWSNDHAGKSKWVGEEAASFRTLMHLDCRQGRPMSRRLVQVCLQGRDEHYSEWHAVSAISDAEAYAKGAANIDPNLWCKVLDRIVAAIAKDDDWPPVLQAVLASTKERMQAIPGSHAPTGSAHDFGTVLTKLGISREALLERYGSERTNWKPFGNSREILTVLSDLRAALLDRQAPRFRWQPVAEEFWSDDPRDEDNISNIVEELCERPAVVVIDALSLYDRGVFERYNRVLPECLANEYAALMVLPPFKNEQRDYLRDVLKATAQKLFEQLYRQEFKKAGRQPRANCSFLTHDDYEMRRMLASAVRISAEKNKWVRF
jgi:hypothetical protein